MTKSKSNEVASDQIETALKSEVAPFEQSLRSVPSDSSKTEFSKNSFVPKSKVARELHGIVELDVTDEVIDKLRYEYLSEKHL